MGELVLTRSELMKIWFAETPVFESYARRVHRDPDRARDAMQHAIEKCLRACDGGRLRVPEGRAATELVRGFVFRTIRNKAIDEHRRGKRLVPEGSGDDGQSALWAAPEEDPEGRLDARALMRALPRALESVSERGRALLMDAVEGDREPRTMSMAERALLYRVRKALRGALPAAEG
jgi:DNA-directed RNA polymerase specialized sigma24 family protein